MLLIYLKADTAKRQVVFFLMENIFTTEASVNNQNEAKSSAVIYESVRTVYRLQKPFSLMV